MPSKPLANCWLKIVSSPGYKIASRYDWQDIISLHINFTLSLMVIISKSTDVLASLAGESESIVGEGESTLDFMAVGDGAFNNVHS